jgi:hypothetical protein
MSDALPVDAAALREEVKSKYREVAVNPRGAFHFHTGRPLARRLAYDEAIVGELPDRVRRGRDWAGGRHLRWRRRRE